MRKFLPAVAAVALAVPLMAVQSARAAEPSEFMRRANQINLEEIELGHYAAEHGVSHEVRDFGSKLAKDHEKAEDGLREVARHLDVHLRHDMDDDTRHKVHHLEDLHGREFDHAYIHAEIDGHEDAIHLYEEARHGAMHRSVRDYAADQLPTLHHHLDTAHDIADHMDHPDHHDGGAHIDVHFK